MKTIPQSYDIHQKEEGQWRADLYLVKSVWDSENHTSRQIIIKYLGVESAVTIDDVPKEYRKCKKISIYFAHQKFFWPENHHQFTAKTITTLVSLLKKGNAIKAYSIYSTYKKIYG